MMLISHVFAQIGLAKDILGLCEENAASKAWIRELAVARMSS